MNARYRVDLGRTERDELKTLLSGGKHAVRSSSGRRFHWLPAGANDDEIATSVGVGGSTVYRTKQHFVLDNLAAALSEAP